METERERERERERRERRRERHCLNKEARHYCIDRMQQYRNHDLINSTKVLYGNIFSVSQQRSPYHCVHKCSSFICKVKSWLTFDGNVQFVKVFVGLQYAPIFQLV